MEILNSLSAGMKLLQTKKKPVAELTTLDHEGVNLLDTEGEGLSKFTLNVFRKLFSVEERRVGFIEILGKKTKSKRVVLDTVRLEKLKTAIEIKFLIAPDKKEKTWAKMRLVCNRHCYDLDAELTAKEQSANKQ
jgi:hypothetical protein